jgi:hypothetical protein
MSTLVARWGSLAALLMPAVLTAAPVPGEKSHASPAEAIRRQLDRVLTLDIDQQPLHLAVNQLHEQTGINFVLDRFTLAQMNVDPDQATVTLRLKDVKVRSALRTLLAPFNLSYAIISDTVIVTSDDMAAYRQMRQRVNVDLDKVELARALRQLARETATNLVVDTRVARDAQQPVTLQMEDVPLETAVRLMAEMVGLKPVRVGNALFVTTKANAAEMRADPDLAPVPQPGNPGERVIVAPGGVAIAPPPPAAPAAGAGAKPAEAEPSEPMKPKADDPKKPADKPTDKPAEKPDKPDKP